MKWLSRVRVQSVVVLALLASLAGNPALANNDLRDELVGLWEGVDSLDGSTVRVAIGDLNGHKSLDFRWYESFFTGCFDAGITSGRGLIAGKVQRLGPDVIELVVTSYVCFDEDNSEIELATFTVDFDYSKENDFLLRTSEDGFPGFILYRTSSTGGQ